MLAKKTKQYDENNPKKIDIPFFGKSYTILYTNPYTPTADNAGIVTKLKLYETPEITLEVLAKMLITQ